MAGGGRLFGASVGRGGDGAGWRPEAVGGQPVPSGEQPHRFAGPPPLLPARPEHGLTSPHSSPVMALFSSSPRPVHVLLSLLFVVSCLQVHAQPSTNMPVPPLQWIELTDLLSASPQPHLKDASIGYDGDGTLLIFGGESSAGFPTSSTYKYVLYILRMMCRNMSNKSFQGLI